MILTNKDHISDLMDLERIMAQWLHFFIMFFFALFLLRVLLVVIQALCRPCRLSMTTLVALMVSFRFISLGSFILVSFLHFFPVTILIIYFFIGRVLILFLTYITFLIATFLVIKALLAAPYLVFYDLNRLFLLCDQLLRDFFHDFLVLLILIVMEGFGTFEAASNTISWLEEQLAFMTSMCWATYSFLVFIIVYAS